MSPSPSFDELVADVSKIMSGLSTLQRQVQAKKAHGLVLDSVKMPAPELLIGAHDDEMVRTFLSACDMYFELTGISDENTRALFAKTRLSSTTSTWYYSHGHNDTTFATVKSHMLDYFIPSDYVGRTRRELVAYKIG